MMSLSSFSDNRGKLIFPIKNNFHVKQCTVSCNKKNVFRGIHINNFEKLVTCIQGKILDIIIDFDKTSPNYLIPKYYTLDPNTDNFQLLIPKNYGHAFLALEENSILLYHLSDEYTDITTKHIHFLDPLLNITLPINHKDLIMSEKDNIKNFINPIDYIIFGSKGYLGSNMVNILKKYNKNFISSDIRLNELDKIKQLIEVYSPKYIINCAGISGNPNIFWCDTNRIETIENNITYQLTLADICKEKNIHLTIFGSGGIFDNKRIYTEDDLGNNFNNFYSESRIYLENIVKNYTNILYLRINYPISNNYSTKNLLTKLLNFTTIDSCKISVTYVNNLFPILLQMIENNEIGICNFTNPGQINIIDILKKYQTIKSVDLNITKNDSFDINNTKSSLSKLECNKLLKYNPLFIDDAIEECIKNYNHEL